MQTAVMAGDSKPADVRRLHLPASTQSPRVARELVRSALAESPHAALVDEALLLTTELATNVVVHTDSELDIEVVIDQAGVQVTVQDHAAGGFAGWEMTGEPAEGGYGLKLVDHFASGWGISRHATGKTVWFRLDQGSPEDTPRPTLPAPLAHLHALLAVELASNSHDPEADFAGRLLQCLADALGAAGVQARVDRGTEDGMHVLASVGVDPAYSEGALRLPLPISRPWAGELMLSAPESDSVAPLVALAAERLGMALEGQRLREADQRRQMWLTFLAEASELLAQSLDPELTAALIPRLVVPRLGAWCAIYLRNSRGNLAMTAAAHADESLLAELVSQLAGQEDLIGDEPGWATRSYQPLAAPLEGLALPLIARGQRHGTLVVGRHLGRRLHAEEVAILEDLTRRAALAIDNARIYQQRRSVAHALQRSLLPPELPRIAGIELAAQYVPVGDDIEVGGDFYDVVAMPNDRWLVVVGDVSGKGVQAANVTGVVREVIRVLIRDGRSLSSILNTLNEILYERGGRYCTLAMAVVERGTNGDPPGALRVSLNLAGHDQPMLLHSNGQVSPAGTAGTAVGLLEEMISPQATLLLRAGDALVFYTDGVTERRRQAEFFGRDRLRRTLGRLAGFSANVLAARLRATVLDFSAESPRDDIAILVVRNNAAS